MEVKVLSPCMAKNTFLLLSKFISGLSADSRLEIIFYQKLEDNVLLSSDEAARNRIFILNYQLCVYD